MAGMRPARLVKIGAGVRKTGPDMVKAFGAVDRRSVYLFACGGSGFDVFRSPRAWATLSQVDRPIAS